MPGVDINLADFSHSWGRPWLAANVQDLRLAFTGCGQRSQVAASVQDLRPAFTGCDQRSGAAARAHRLRLVFRICDQRSRPAASVQDLRPAFTACCQRSGLAASVHSLRPASSTPGSPRHPTTAYTDAAGMHGYCRGRPAGCVGAVGGMTRGPPGANPPNLGACLG